MKQLVIGWGNPAVGDDGLGWKVAELVRERLADAPGVEVVKTSHGGLRTAERMLGYDRVVLVDAHLADGSDSLQRTVVRPDTLPPQQADFGHDGSITQALRVLGQLQAEGLPQEVVFLSAPIAPPDAWCSSLSEAAQHLALHLAEAVAWEVQEVAVA